MFCPTSWSKLFFVCNNLETEYILNNRLIANYYSIDLKPCLTPNHLLYGRTLILLNTDMNDINYSIVNPILESQKLNNIFNHFWNRWQKEYLCNFREPHKPNKLRTTFPIIIEINDIAIVHVDKLPKSQWKLGLVTKLIPSRDTKVRGAKVRSTKTNTFIIRPVNKLYLFKSLNTNSTRATINKDTVQRNTKLKREAAVTSNMKTKFCS